jgi:hypothetical protein
VKKNEIKDKVYLKQMIKIAIHSKPQRKVSKKKNASKIKLLKTIT